MAVTPRIYERLTRPQAGLAMYSSLWLASDHVLLVRSTGYSEQYQRFQLSEIQAFVIGASSRRGNIAITLIVLCLIALFPLVLSLLNHGSIIVQSCFFLLAVVLLLRNYLLGPGCNVSVVTAVQTTRFPLVRRPRADRVLARLRPLIEAAQADFPADAGLVPNGPPPIP